MNTTKLNPDLHAGLLALLALACDAIVMAVRGEGIMSGDLWLGLSAFVVAAFTRWRMALAKPAEVAPTPGSAVPEHIDLDVTPVIDLDEPTKEGT